MSKQPVFITFLPQHIVAKASQDDTILDVAIKNKVNIHHSCGGMGSCGTCRIVVSDDCASLSEQNDIEKEMSIERNFKKNERLACQTQALASISVTIPQYNDEQ